jgi:hypothetical protein
MKSDRSLKIPILFQQERKNFECEVKSVAIITKIVRCTSTCMKSTLWNERAAE